jgi:hypothetical protein
MGDPNDFPRKEEEDDDDEDEIDETVCDNLPF